MHLFLTGRFKPADVERGAHQTWGQKKKRFPTPRFGVTSCLRKSGAAQACAAGSPRHSPDCRSVASCIGLRPLSPPLRDSPAASPVPRRCLQGPPWSAGARVCGWRRAAPPKPLRAVLTWSPARRLRELRLCIGTPSAMAASPLSVPPETSAGFCPLDGPCLPSGQPRCPHIPGCLAPHRASWGTAIAPSSGP